MTWSKGRTCSGGDGNAPPAPERERERGEGDIKVEGRDECAYAGTYVRIWEQARLENIELERTANEAGGRN